MSTQENEYQVCVLFDASVNTTVRAATPEAAAQEAEEQTDGAQCLCHQCSSQLDTADAYGVHVYQNDKLVLDTTRAGELEAENTALKARVAELEALSVTNILVNITPGDDGMGHEIYATSVDEVVEKLSDLGSRLEDYELGISVPPSGLVDREDAGLLRGLHWVTQFLGTPTGDAYQEALEAEAEKVSAALNGDMTKSTIDQYRGILAAGLAAASATIAAEKGSEE